MTANVADCHPQYENVVYLRFPLEYCGIFSHRRDAVNNGYTLTAVLWSTDYENKWYLTVERKILTSFG